MKIRKLLIIKYSVNKWNKLIFNFRNFELEIHKIIGHLFNF